jgi:hypothetical protein
VKSVTPSFLTPFLMQKNLHWLYMKDVARNALRRSSYLLAIIRFDNNG